MVTHSHKKMSKKQQGFTLIEVLVVVVVMGFIMTLFSSVLGQMLGAQRLAQVERDRFENMQIANAVLETAKINDGEFINTGKNVPFVDAGGALKDRFISEIESRGLGEGDARSRRGTGATSRVYQSITNTIDRPMYGSSGPTIQLRTTQGVIYVEDPDFAGSTSLNDYSSVMALDSSEARALGAYRFSNISLQESLLETTVRRVERLSSTISRINNLSRLAADPADIANNFYPGDGLFLGGVQNGCSHNWVNLSAAGNGATIMNEIGLSQEEFGKTAWGYPVYYCRELQGTSITQGAGLSFGRQVATGGGTAGTSGAVLITP